MRQIERNKILISRFLFMTTLILLLIQTNNLHIAKRGIFIKMFSSFVYIM